MTIQTQYRERVRGASISSFTAGTRVRTTEGDVCVEDLRIGSRLVTKDFGVQALKYFDIETLVLDDERSSPLRISAGVLGAVQDLFLDSEQLVLLRHPLFDMMFGSSQVLTRAQNFAGIPGVSRCVGLSEISAVSLGFARPQIVFSEGLSLGLCDPAGSPPRQILSAEETQLAARLLIHQLPSAKRHSFPLH